MVVVEDKHRVGGQLRELVQQGGQDSLDGWRLRGVKQHQRGIPGTRIKAVRYSNKVAPEARGVVVARIQGEPDGGATAAGGDSEPHAQQGGLAETGGRRDEGELASQLFFESLAKAQAGNEGGACARDRQLGQ